MPLRVTALLLHLALVVGTLAAAAAPASAQRDPFSSPQPLVTPERPNVERAPIEEEDEGLETWQELIIFFGGFGVLVGIAAAIIIDARRRRPAADEELKAQRTAGSEGHDAEHRRAENRKRRAKAKQARESRKRNRPKR